MKIKHLFGLAVLAAMTASCSSNDDLASNPGTGANETGVGYATFSINLPTTSGGSRADGDPTFDGGTAKEYDVNDASLVIFKKAGTSENDYTYLETVSLGNMAPWVKKNADGVTTEAKITAQLSQVNLTDEYYALVILNNKDANGADKVTLPSATSTTSDTQTPDTYASWNVAANVDGEKLADNTKGFYMANAPHYVDAAHEPETLVKIEKVYSTKQAAESNTGTTIHVERGLAKVTVSSLPTDQTPSGTAYNKDKVDITAWNLDVTNTKSFPVHKTSGLKTNFADIWKNESGTTAATARFVDGSNTSFKRVYWGIDPNYSTDYTTVDACGKEFTLLAHDAAITGTADAPQYCLENTFNIKHMMQGQTTRVVFKANYTPNGFNKNDNFYKIGNRTELWNEAKLIDQIKAKTFEVLGLTSSDAQSKVSVDLAAADNNIQNTAGTRLLTKDNVENDGTAVTDDQINQINSKLGLKAATTTEPVVGIATYKSGECYYIARVKHFNELTPWSEGNDTYGDDNNDNNKKYLGRYGVLRNNWYDLTVNSVSGPGTPDIPTVNPDFPDDENFKYINVSVKILDWAKRSQRVDL